jgi:hypothetical protein
MVTAIQPVKEILEDLRAQAIAALVARAQKA